MASNMLSVKEVLRFIVTESQNAYVGLGYNCGGNHPSNCGNNKHS